MNNILTIFNKIHSLNCKYKLPTEIIEQQIKAYENQKLSIPIIGKFSSGKTALINTLLGYSTKLLRENITPETAVPTEITFVDGYDVVLVKSDEGTHTTTIETYKNTEYDFNMVRSISIKLDNRFLESIKDVMIVDMPGFDSGYEVHNKAIDYYLPMSLAYLITFSAEDMTLKNNMISVLKELVLNDMPICIVITKVDKVPKDVLDENINKLKYDLEKHIGKRNLRFCITSSSMGEVGELKEFLQDIQAESQGIIGRKYKAIALKIVSDIEMFLNNLIQNQGLTMSELSEKEESLRRELDELHKSFSLETDSFNRIIPNCIQEIKADLLNVLMNEESSFVAMIMNGQEISERVNAIVRNAVTQSIKERFIPKVQKHIETIATQINTLVSADPGLLCRNFSLDTNDVVKTVVNTTVAAIGLIILGPLVALVGGLIAWFIGNKQKEREREAQKSLVSQKLRSDIFPSVIQQVGKQLEIELTRNAEEINKLLSEEINSQYNTLNLALGDVISQGELEKKEKEQLLKEAYFDLEEMRGIKNECN
jgi:GTP-binding protein EngB required for normal cell division